VRKGSSHHGATPASHMKLHKRRMAFERGIPWPNISGLDFRPVSEPENTVLRMPR
jgi:hypothetical protein